MTLIIKTNGCHDCPFATPHRNMRCQIPLKNDGGNLYVHNHWRENMRHEECPLIDGDITVTADLKIID